MFRFRDITPPMAEPTARRVHGSGILGSLINRIVVRIVKKRLPDSTAFDRGQRPTPSSPPEPP